MRKGDTHATLEERLWRRVEKSDGCWLWIGATDSMGYGVIWAGKDGVERWGKWPKTHRVAYELVIGSIPEGLLVCHTCDNPPCCNPDHLWLGTHSDNVLDAVAKGRWTQGRRFL